MGKTRLAIVTVVVGIGLMAGNNPLYAGVLLGGAFLLAKPSIVTRTWKVVADWADDWEHAVTRPDIQNKNRTKIIRH